MAQVFKFVATKHNEQIFCEYLSKKPFFLIVATLKIKLKSQILLQDKIQATPANSTQKIDNSNLTTHK